MFDFASEVAGNIVYIISWLKDVLVLLIKSVGKLIKKLSKNA